jgi:hypothetical protein
MTSPKCFHIIDLKQKLGLSDNEKNHVGAIIGIADQRRKIWKCAIYAGNGNILVLFEKGKGVTREAFQLLLNLKPIDKSTLEKEAYDSKWLIDMNSVKFEEDLWNEIEFFLYSVNLIDTCVANKVKPGEFLENLKFSLAHIEHLEEGDIVAFDRSWYQHHAVLTGNTMN